MSEVTITQEMWQDLNYRLAELERRTVGMVKLGPNQQRDYKIKREMEEQVSKMLEEKFQAEVELPPPVDRANQQLVSGDPVPADRSHTELRESGQQKDYVVLTKDEREKGFVRPFRDAYRHAKCGKITTMGRAIAETYARDPEFYTGTMCVHCKGHYPIGPDGEFTWYEMDGAEGPKVGV